LLTHCIGTNQHQLTVPRCRRITFGRRAFSVAGPTVWNSLPTEFLCLTVLITSGGIVVAILVHSAQ